MQRYLGGVRLETVLSHEQGLHVRHQEWYPETQERQRQSSSDRSAVAEDSRGDESVNAMFLNYFGRPKIQNERQQQHMQQRASADEMFYLF